MAYLDIDDLNKPHSGNAQVYAVDNEYTITRNSVIKKCPAVFGAGVGFVEEEYHIRIDPWVNAVHHAPCRVLQITLEELTQQDVIAQVTQPTPWISL